MRAFENHVAFDSERCNACGLCARTCPELVFVQPGKHAKVQVVHPERCVGCLSCEEDCAKHALKIYRLPAGQGAKDVPPAARGVDGERIYDLLVVGAGPAGLGAALRARALGLSVALVERLPSHRRSHHPDGGLLFAAKDIYGLATHDDGLHLKELDLTIPAALVRERLQDFAMVGPGGRRTRGYGKRWTGFAVVPKDRLVEFLADLARERGAEIFYNTRVSALEAPRDGRPGRLVLDRGASLAGKVLISAEGTSGRLSESAGIKVNENAVGWSYCVESGGPPRAKPSEEFAFLLGALESEPADAKRAFLGFWSTGPAATHFGLGTLQKKKTRAIAEPLSAVLTRALAQDSRFRGALGSCELPQTLDGCRVLARRLPKSAVGQGVLAVGDAIATCGMATTLVALKTGDLAASVAAEALARGDVSAQGLAAFDRKVFGLSMIEGMSWMHKLLIEAPLLLPDEQLEALFGMLQRLALPKLMSGGWGAAWALTRFYAGNSWAMMRNPTLRPYLKP